jgi:hypothetical protein
MGPWGSASLFDSIFGYLQLKLMHPMLYKSGAEGERAEKAIA